MKCTTLYHGCILYRTGITNFFVATLLGRTILKLVFHHIGELHFSMSIMYRSAIEVKTMGFLFSLGNHSFCSTLPSLVIGFALASFLPMHWAFLFSNFLLLLLWCGMLGLFGRLFIFAKLGIQSKPMFTYLKLVMLIPKLFTIIV